ncbi:MAG: hypothetical protein R2753_06890 [Chitinophagales bacterium]
MNCIPAVRICGINWDVPLLLSRILYSYNFTQSLVAAVSTNPLSLTALSNASPSNSLTSTREIPTFILHGDSDILVPYTQSTVGMESRLDSYGGIIQNNGSNIHDGTNVAIPASSTYATLSDKHLIKLYTGVGHGGRSGTNGPLAIRTDIITWLNGHIN